MLRKVSAVACVVLLVLATAVIAVACGDEGTPETTATTATTEQVTTTSAPVQTTGATTTETTGESVTPVTLKLQGAFPEGTAHYYYFDTFCQKVQEYSGGTLTVEWGAGPEAIPSNELAEAMVSDTVQLVFTPLAYTVSHMPVLVGVKLLDPDACRTNGGYEYINELCEEGLNAHFLGRPANGLQHAICVNKKITTLEDFNGLRIRATSVYEPLLKALGAGIVSMPLGDIYDAIQRNVVDGAGVSLTDITDNSLQDVIKYLILPMFYISDSSLLCPLGTWDELAQVQKDALSKAALDWEKDAKVHNTSIQNDVIKQITEAGVEVIEFQGEMRETWLKTAYDEVWKQCEAADPDIAAKLKTFATQ